MIWLQWIPDMLILFHRQKKKKKKSSERHKEYALKHNTTSTETITWSLEYLFILTWDIVAPMWRLLDRVKHLQREILPS